MTTTATTTTTTTTREVARMILLNPVFLRPVIAGADIVELIGDPPHVRRILLELIYKHFVNQAYNLLLAKISGSVALSDCTAAPPYVMYWIPLPE